MTVRDPPVPSLVKLRSWLVQPARPSFLPSVTPGALRMKLCQQETERLLADTLKTRFTGSPFFLSIKNQTMAREMHSSKYFS